MSKFSVATKILLNGNKEAYGIEYERHGSKLTAIATKEVILCAGTLSTPKLLMLSGIGPKDHLSALGVRMKN